MAGELMGLDGLAHGIHTSSATSLEEAQVCTIPHDCLGEYSVCRAVRREIVREHSLMLLLGSINAEERLAAFLLNLGQRLEAGGRSGAGFDLRMSRAEIGSYLGMKREMVERVFSVFQQQRLLDAAENHVRIVDPDGLAGACQMRVQ